MQNGASDSKDVKYASYLPSLTRFWADLARDKSARACLPLGRRDAAPAQSGAGRLEVFGWLHLADCPTAFGLMANETDETSTGRFIRRFQRSAFLTCTT
jgi:hypothetical protein